MFAKFGTFFTPTVKIFKHFARLLSASCPIPRQICISQLSKNNIGLQNAPSTHRINACHKSRSIPDLTHLSSVEELVRHAITLSSVIKNTRKIFSNFVSKGHLYTLKN